MEAKNIKFGFNTLISISFGLISSMSVWFALQGEVSLHTVRIERLEKVQEEEAKANKVQFKEVHSEYKELTKTLHEFKYEIIKAIQEKENGR